MLDHVSALQLREWLLISCDLQLCDSCNFSDVIHTLEVQELLFKESLPLGLSSKHPIPYERAPCVSEWNMPIPISLRRS